MIKTDLDILFLYIPNLDKKQKDTTQLNVRGHSSVEMYLSSQVSSFAEGVDSNLLTY